MSKTKKSPSAPFLWGASSSAHQIEGGTFNQWTVWEKNNAAVLAEQAKYLGRQYPDFKRLRPYITKPENYISGRLADHYNRYEADFDILEQLGLNAFRFSIEWSRIQPASEHDWEDEAVDHYRRYLQSLKKRGITPVVTLWHFTHPVWFEAKGAFEQRRNIRYFVRYVQRLMQELGEDIEYVVPINEPDTYALESYARVEWPAPHPTRLNGLKVYWNLLAAHRQVYRLLKQQRGQHYQVGFNKGYAYYYTADGAWNSRLAAWGAYLLADDLVMALLRRQYDYVAVNYYFAVRLRGFRVNNPPNEPLSDMGWGMQPQYLAPVLVRLYRRCKKPILVTETGVADVDDKYRKWWITENLKALSAARKQGVKLIGYMHWALLDNFEWAHGRWPCFGLVAVNYATLKRTIRPSAKWYAAAIAYFRHRHP
ncbi:glycoside hydrolase family 1 protein [Candidatus Saccharibacteria bacterium]|nr:glycoside hydrolase family 1 protein [Candidatus Saccharibacteria bacterium]